MEPNKLEKQFRKQLNAREIQPSEMAWNKLDAMLTVADPSNTEQAKQKPKVKFPWMYVAASFVGFVLLGTVYFNQNSSEIINQKKDVVIQNDAALKSTVVSDTNVKLQTESEEAVAVVSKTNQGSIKNPILKQKSDIVSSNSNQNQVVAVSIKNHSNRKTIIVNSALEDNNQSTSMSKYVSAEKLLAEVTNTKLESQSMDKSANKTTTIIAVSPNLLLQNVETELNQSFRESALNRLNKNIKTIKTVLANRNYEE
ncbi:hypothetical protein ACNQGO_07705 [Flavobacterium sp. ZT3P35]|uniref:hypothetical protein n=1 Tax=Flavobacterium sp. ZT3P35 TaxID=3401727 RepID=UPI003AAF5879